MADPQRHTDNSSPLHGGRLSRPHGGGGGRRRFRRRQPRGIALFTTILGLALMSVVVTDMSYNETVRFKLAAHERDLVKAEALAESGLNMAKLVLAVQSALQPGLNALAKMGIPLPAHTVWKLIPLESDLIKGLTSGMVQGAIGLDVSEQLEERNLQRNEQIEEAQLAFDPDAEGAGNGPFEVPPGGFGAFDGSFSVDIEDEEKKPASLRGWMSLSTNRFAIAQRLFTVFQPERYDFLFEERDAYDERFDRLEMVGNIYDYVDSNEENVDATVENPTLWGTMSSGVEDSNYTSYDDVTPRNAYFDSHAELRLVAGMSDAMFRAFSEQISIYGENKINIMSAPATSIETLIRICAQDPNDFLLTDPLWMQQTLGGWQQCKSLGPLITGIPCQVSPEGFVAFLSSGSATEGTALMVDQAKCTEAISTESKHFTVRSTGTVGDVSRTLTLVVRVHRANEERYFFSILK